MRTQTTHVTVNGIENVPARGAVMLVARHYHHLLDGAVLVQNVPRPVHIVVGLDWATNASQRTWMERMCRAAEYPIVLRPPTLASSAAYDRRDLLRYTRTALKETTRLLHDGRVLVVFPEGYPNVDPTGTRKPGADDWLPFASGMLKMIELAERDGRTHVSVVPVGFHYTPTATARGKRWSIVARIGAPIAERDLGTIEAGVRALSA